MIRPLEDSEVAPALQRLTSTPYFRTVIGRLLPGRDVDEVCAHMRTLRSKLAFQQAYIFPLLRHMVESTTTAFTRSGLEGVSADRGCLFVTNHRDIIMDSAFLCDNLLREGRDVCQIGIGSNLLIYPWISDLVRLNRSYVVERDLPVRQTLQASHELSDYIRSQVLAGQTLWLAEREGRSKDGNDRAQSSVFKMLHLSSPARSLEEGMRELRIVPVTISYEFDPCDYLKAHQAQLKRDDPHYKKDSAEDLTHMSVGFKGAKGGVHFAFRAPLDGELQGLDELPRNQQFDELCRRIDQAIHGGYHIFPGQWVALDELQGGAGGGAHYTSDERDAFLGRLERQLDKLPDCDRDFCRRYMLQAYANPLINKRAAGELR